MIRANYLPATEKKGSRIAVVSRSGRTVTSYSDHENKPFEYAVKLHIEKFGLPMVDYAETEISVGGKVYRVYIPSTRPLVEMAKL